MHPQVREREDVLVGVSFVLVHSLSLLLQRSAFVRRHVGGSQLVALLCGSLVALWVYPRLAIPKRHPRATVCKCSDTRFASKHSSAAVTIGAPEAPLTMM
jgi:hypothetical protein